MTPIQRVKAHLVSHHQMAPGKASRKHLRTHYNLHLRASKGFEAQGFPHSHPETDAPNEVVEIVSREW